MVISTLFYLLQIRSEKIQRVLRVVDHTRNYRCGCASDTMSVSQSVHQIVISHSFLIGIELLTMRWKAIEPNFHLQLESSQNIKCFVRYGLLKVTLIHKPLWRSGVTLMNTCSYSYDQMELLVWVCDYF